MVDMKGSHHIVGLFPEVQISPNGKFKLQHKFSESENSQSQNIEISREILSSIIASFACANLSCMN